MQEDSYWTRGSRRSRRRLLASAGGAGAGALALAVAGCGGGDDGKKREATAPQDTAPASGPAAGAAGAAAPKRGGEITLGIGTVSETLDPHTSLSQAFIFWGLFGNLLVYPHAKTLDPIQPGLVEKWEQPGKGDLILHARQGAIWHKNKVTNGRAVVAKDIAYNIERIAGKHDPDRVAQFQRRSNLAGLDKAQPVDEKAVKVTFSTPNAIFLNGLADWRNWAVPEELVQKDPNFKNYAGLAGTGPFSVEEWDTSTGNSRYVAHREYWDRGKPYLDAVQLISLPDAASSLSAFLSGKLDLRYVTSEEDRATVAKSRPQAKIDSWEQSLWDYLRLNQSRPQFTDPRVRKAIFLALNYSELLDAAYGKGFWSFTGPLPSGFPGAWTSDELAKMPGWNPSTKQQDIAEAKKLMEAAGYPDGKIEFSITPLPPAGGVYHDYGVRAKDQLSRIWPAMKVSIIEKEFADFSRALATGDYDVTSYPSSAAPAVLLEAGLYYKTGGSRNYTKFSDPDVDRLIDQGIQEFDATARTKIVGDLQKRLLDTIFLLPVGKRKAAVARQPKVQGFEGFSGPGTYNTYDLFLSAGQLWLQ